MTQTIHSLIFQNDVKSLAQHLKTTNQDIDSLFRGQTPLTLAITLGHKECVAMLLENGASCRTKNAFGWTPFQEATSYGDRDIMRLIHVQRRREYSKWVDNMGKKLLQDLSMVKYR